MKSFLVWILLIALPLQGFAAVSMAMCEPGSAAVATAASAAAHHGVPAPVAKDCAHHNATPPPTENPGDCDTPSDDAKCSACAACSVGASITVAFATLPAATTHGAGPIPYVAAHDTGCIYGALERPPHTLA